MYIGQQPVVGRYIKVDQISGGFNGTASGFTLAAGGQGVLPGTARNLMLSLGGVIQEPETDFTVSGSGITFTTPPVSGTTFFCVVFGDMQAVGTPSDGTVLPASISTSGTFVFPNVTVSGTTVIASGTAAAPSLAVSGDLNTGLYSPGADQLAISTGGSQRLNIDANGRLNVAANSQGIRFGTQANISAAEGAELILNNLGAQPIAFYTNNSERLRITSTGLVGVGTSSPNYRLDIAGSANSTAIGTTLAYGTSAEVYSAFRFNNSSFSGGSSEIRNIANGSSHLGSTLAFFTSQTGTGTLTQRLAIDFLGRVGIGTSSPAAELDVQGGANIGDATSTVRITADGTNGYIGTSTNHPLRIRTNNLSAITIDTSQRVGIGTSSPTNKLTIYEAAANPVRLIQDHATSSAYGIEFYSQASTPYTVSSITASHGAAYVNPYLDINVADSSRVLQQRVRIDASGRVGIGITSPGGLLDVYASSGNNLVRIGGAAGTSNGIYFRAQNTNYAEIYYNDSGSYPLVIGTKAGAGPIIFNTVDNERARIDSSGRLLVGTSSSISNVYVGGSAYQSPFQVIGNAAGYGNGLTSLNYSAGGYGATLTLGISKNATVGVNGAVANADDLGIINFVGNDGTNFRTGAYIIATVDGTPGTADLPTRLSFWTAADGTVAPTERLRIKSSGELVKYGDSTTARIVPQTDNAGYLGESAYRWQAVYAVNGTIQTSDMREKTDIVDSPLGANFIRSLRPVAYKWKIGGYTSTYDENGKETITPNPGVRTHYGFIAQEVKQAIGKTDFGGWLQEDLNDPESQQSLRLHEFISPIVKALQEALDEIDTLKAKVAALESA